MRKSAYLTIDPQKIKFLGLPTLLTEGSQVDIFDNGSEFDRIKSDGLLCLRIKQKNKIIAVAATDFRIRGGTFGKSTSKKFCGFLESLMNERDVPLIVTLNSMGARFWEGRTVFGPVFSILPTLFRFADKHPLYTIAAGKTIGISAPIFAIGHLRICQAKGAQLSLTGPSVITNFFGTELDFDAICSPQRQQEETALVHEIADCRYAALDRALTLIHFRRGISAGKTPASLACEFPSQKSRTVAKRLLEAFGDEMVEVFPELSPVVRTYLVRKGDAYFGLFLNPPFVANNMVTADALIRYDEALAYFRAERLPILSCLDTPGIDPRRERSGLSITQLIRNVARKIIEHPYPRMGIISGRCYGGAASLGFPKCFGEAYNLALRGANVGVMAQDSITAVLKDSKQLTTEWMSALSTQDEGLNDLLRGGLLDAVIEPDALSFHVDRWLKAKVKNHSLRDQSATFRDQKFSNSFQVMSGQA